MTEIERLIDMLSCGNSMPQERIRWAHSIVDLAREEGRAEGVEKWKWRTRADKLFGYWVRLLRFPPDERRTLDVETEVNGIQYVMIPASALAPSSERAGGLPEVYGDALPIKEKP